MKEMKLIEIGKLTNGVYAKMHDSSRRVYSTDGLSPTINTVGGGNLEPKILTPKRTEYGKQIRKDYESGKVKESRHNMTELEPREDGISNTLTSVQKDNLLAEPGACYQVRKLTPKECFRLMGFSDEDFDKAKYYTKEESEELLKCYPKHNGKRQFTYEQRIERTSNSQLYKQAGNSIVVNVLEAIFKQML